MSDRLLSEGTLLIYSELLQAPEGGLYGMELIERTGLVSGTLYPLLARGVEAGTLERRVEETAPRVMGRPSRTYYTLTPLGRDLAASRIMRLARSAAGAGAPPGDNQGTWMLLRVDAVEYMSEGEVCAAVADRFRPTVIRDLPVHPLDKASKTLYLLPNHS